MHTKHTPVAKGVESEQMSRLNNHEVPQHVPSLHDTKDSSKLENHISSWSKYFSGYARWHLGLKLR